MHEAEGKMTCVNRLAKDAFAQMSGPGRTFCTQFHGR
jgi:hypothetical protein